MVLRNLLKDYSAKNILVIGSGTGKNTTWLVQNFEKITCVDFSEEMLAVAQKKIARADVEFIQADITGEWSFLKCKYDLIVFSLVLEHIVDLDHIFKEAFNALNDGGIIYIGELHPFKQYSGSKARFETLEGTETLTCYTHHITEFIDAAQTNKLQLKKLEEHFDEADKSGLPRILTLLFEKSTS